MIKPVILCGGVGSRLWPLSTPQKPKQFLSLTAPDSMIALTYGRLKQPSGEGPKIDKPLVVGAKQHETLLREELPGADYILEPFGRNSAPAIAAACLVSQPDDILLILSADHHIENPAAFLEAVSLGIPEAEAGNIVTFGIQPTYPATTYGYIETDLSPEAVRKVLSFVEKPKHEIAKRYVDQGRHFWNAGIFLFKASTMTAALSEHAPELLEGTRHALGRPIQGTWHLEPGPFKKVENISIDYAVMEHSQNIKLVPVDMGWNDVGSYDALWGMSATSTDDNVTHGPVVTEKSQRLFVRSEGPTVCVSGLEDCVVVATPDLVMVTPRGDPEAIKSLGNVVQASSQSLPISQAIRQRANETLWDAFDTWIQAGWDHERGGFVECLHMNGAPDFDTERRIRVQARQIFSFSRAISLGWPGHAKAHRLIMDGLEFVDQTCRHKEGGWVHMIDRNGQVTDDKRDLYDHSFLMMAGAAAYQATGEASALKLAEQALDFIDTNLHDPNRGGFFESAPNVDGRRANPHMHLLEAFLVMHGATRDQAYLERASDMVTLFERRFFLPGQDILCERFDNAWNEAEGEAGQIFEPGHHYEWASLLALHDKRTGRDTGSWRRRLIRKADQFGRDPVRSLAYNEVHTDGTPHKAGQRIWPQLEMFRARLFHPETAAAGDANNIFTNIEKTYFSHMPKGTWLDEIDGDGNPVSDRIPASILYHLVSAFSPSFVSDPRLLGPRAYRSNA